MVFLRRYPASLLTLELLKRGGWQNVQDHTFWEVYTAVEQSILSVLWKERREFRDAVQVLNTLLQVTSTSEQAAAGLSSNVLKEAISTVSVAGSASLTRQKEGWRYA